ncbi:unnamed protein product, partial [Dicrocoelium dendriticum]
QLVQKMPTYFVNGKKKRNVKWARISSTLICCERRFMRPYSKGYFGAVFPPIYPVPCPLIVEAFPISLTV